MDILIGLIPALCWGLLPISATRIGGKPVNQILGTTVGTFFVAVLIYWYFRPDISMKTAVLSALSGALWVIGQIGQYVAYTHIGVSKTMPISTGLQLVGTSLIGVFVFGEWPSLHTRVIGFTALAIVIIGVCLTSIKRGSSNQGGVSLPTLTLLFVTNFGYLAYSSIPDAVGAKGVAIFLPQAAGMVVAAVLYVILSRQPKAFKQPESWKNILTGFLFSGAAFFYILSAQRNGIATGFVLSQLSVVLATFLGIFILGEEKSAFEMKATIIGLILIVAGGAGTALLHL